MTQIVWNDTRTKKIGIFGGGQLGFMQVLAARAAGLYTVVYCQSVDEPAVGSADEHIIGDWDDRNQLCAFAETGIEWLIGEFENANPDSVDYLESLGVTTYTMADVLRVGRDRLLEKNLAGELGIPVTKYEHFAAAIVGTFRKQTHLWAPNLIVKTRRLGYDGKGQKSFDNGLTGALEHSEWKSDVDYILEEKVDFAYECSVCVVRTADGEIKYTPAIKNTHTNRHGGGILEVSAWAPGLIPEDIEERAQQYAVKMAEKLSLVGVITVEFFVAHDDQVIFNEFAPRPHNSLHLSREAAMTDQYDWHVAAVVGEPIADMRFIGPCVMVNGISEDIDLKRELRRRGYRITDYRKLSYGKARKMMHAVKVLRYGEDLDSIFTELREMGLVA